MQSSSPESRAAFPYWLGIVFCGLLIWHVVGKHPMLEESHGVEGPAGPLVYLKNVPYPSEANDAFTPFTVPSSRSQLGGGKPVYVTNIRRLPDGRITFYLGYVYE